jgi:hypothetical protein
VTRTCGNAPAGRTQSPLADADAAGEDVGLPVGVACVLAGGLVVAAALGDGDTVDGETDGVADGAKVSRHCWFVCPLHTQWMIAAPSAFDRPVTSRHLPFWTFFSA